MQRICHNSKSSRITQWQWAWDVFALKQVGNNGSLFCAAEIDILTGQRSGAVIIKLPCAVGGTWHLGDWGESVSLALDYIQPSTDLHRALMTKQFSCPKSCSSDEADWENILYHSVAKHNLAHLEGLLTCRWFRQKMHLSQIHSHDVYLFMYFARRDDVS